MKLRNCRPNLLGNDSPGRFGEDKERGMVEGCSRLSELDSGYKLGEKEKSGQPLQIAEAELVYHVFLICLGMVWFVAKTTTTTTTNFDLYCITGGFGLQYLFLAILISAMDVQMYT